jgi:putative transposase
LITFIDREKERFGVEPICRVLSAHDCKIAPSTYYARKTRPLSARAIQDAIWQPILLALWTANYRVYGVHKLWKAARRDGHELGRDQVARLMRAMQIKGATRMRRVRTTIRDDSAPRSPDLVKRDFTADRPNRLWLTDFERHEAFLNLAVVKGHRHQFVAADWLKLRAA